ncbi:MAG: purine-nucleoside phosphorylase [Elusimicrobia bacterium]|nr:purine-nucleoside phosphorylase [Elusimicrobiota bacterium]
MQYTEISKIKLLKQNLDKTKKYIEERTKKRPVVGVILGSGLSSISGNVEDSVTIPYSSIPSFKESSIEGHKCELVIGNLSGKNVIIMAGRIHFYEGYTLKDVTYPIRVLKELGVKKLILTSATGAVNRKFRLGDIILVTDHINFMGINPLIGPEGVLQGVRFPDMSEVYKNDLVKKAEFTAKKLNIKIRKGVYFACTGPSYETPAEVKMAVTLGADIVGMSTVPEAIVANHCGIKVLGVSYISNMAAGILKQPLNHKEVIKIGKKTEEKLGNYIKEIIRII